MPPNQGVPEEGAPFLQSEAALRGLGQFLRDQNYSFTTVTPATHLKVNSRPENAVGRTLRDIFGWNRPFHRSALPEPVFDLMGEARILLEDAGMFRSWLRCSTLNGNYFFHSGYPTQEANAVFFGPDTYRFVGAIKRHLEKPAAPVLRAVDIGAGAGPGGIAIAQARPLAWVAMVDINDAALALARTNAALADAPNADAIESNLLDAVKGSFDLIVSNPPYLVDPALRVYRHGGGAKGAALSLDILACSLGRLAPGGALLLYTGVAIFEGRDPFLESAAKHLSRSNYSWTYDELDPDVFAEELDGEAYRDADRIAVVLLEVRRDR